MDGLGAIKGGCPRCQLLFEIWDASLRLNQLIRKFDPGHDDLKPLRVPELVPQSDPRQLLLIAE